MQKIPPLSLMLSEGFVVDNSSLNLILTDKSVSSRLSKMPINLIIPKETYLEAHAGRLEFIYPRMVELVNFNMRSEAVRFYFAPSFFNILRRESKRGGILKSIPVLNGSLESKHLEIFSSLERYKAFRSSNLNDSISRSMAAKDRTLSSDKMQMPINEFSDEQIREIIKSFKGVTKLREIRSNFIQLYEEVISKTKLRSALSSQKHLHLRAYINAVALRDLGKIIRNFRPNDELKFLKEKKKGNWYDLYFVGWTADKYNLLTEDSDLRKMHGFFRERGLNCTIARSISDLVAAT